MIDIRDGNCIIRTRVQRINPQDLLAATVRKKRSIFGVLSIKIAESLSISIDRNKHNTEILGT